MARERGSSVLNVHSGYTPFLPSKLPDVIKKMIPICSKLSKDVFRKVLQVVIKDIEGKCVPEEVMEKLHELTELNVDVFTSLYAGVLMLMRYALRHPQTSMKQELFQAELDEIKFPKELSEDVVSIVFGERQGKIEQLQVSGRTRLATVDSIRWRVDVAISTSVLNRVLEPTIMMEIKDSTGKTTTFEISQSKFHELRYNMAHLLKEMGDLEKRSVLKI